jgi:hypothetical protein
MSRRKLPLELPLESSDWVLIAKAFELHTQHTGADDQLTCLNFNQALKAKARRLRSKVRYADGRSELLAVAAWQDLYVNVQVAFGRLLFAPGRPQDLPRTEIAVLSRKNGKRPPGCWFYVWWPDYKNIFEPVTAPAEQRTPSPEVPVKRGKKPVYNRADLQSVALWFSLQRKQGAPPKTQTDVIDELREWCKRNKQKVPSPSTLYEIAAAAFRIKPTLKS